MRKSLELYVQFLDPSPLKVKGKKGRKWGFYDPGNGGPCKKPFDEIREMAGLYNTFYVDSIPRDAEWLLRKEGSEIKRLRHTRQVEEFRQKYDLMKSEENDALVLSLILEDDGPSAFRPSTGTTTLVNLYRKRHQQIQRRTRLMLQINSWGEMADTLRSEYEERDFIDGKIKETERELKEELKKYPIAAKIEEKMRGVGFISIANVLAPIEQVAGSIFGVHSKQALRHIFGQFPGRNDDKKVGIEWKPSHKKGEDNTFSKWVKSDIWMVPLGFERSRNEEMRTVIEEEKERQLKREYPKGELAKLPKRGYPGQSTHYKNYKYDDIHITVSHARDRGRTKAIVKFLDYVYSLGKWLKEEGLPWRLE